MGTQEGCQDEPVGDTPSGRDAAWCVFCWLTIRNKHDTFKQIFIEHLFNEKGVLYGYT